MKGREMSGIEQFENQSYLSLQTYRKNGDAIPTPVWFVQDGEKFYVRTIAGSGKVKRVHNNPQVQIMACGERGELLGTWIAAQAHEIPDQATFEHVKSLLIAKYGEIVQTLETQAEERGQKYTILLVEPEQT
jgi:PPOX class probable F420-dependent enzyme